MRRPLRSVLLAQLILLVGVLPTWAADKVVQQIPDNVLGFVVIRNLEKASLQIDQAAQRMQLPAPGLLRLAKSTLGLQDGFKDNAQLALAIFERPDTGEPFPVIFLETEDYASLVGQLEVLKRGDVVNVVRTGTDRSCVARKGDYALFSPPQFVEELESVVQSKISVKVDKTVDAFADDANAYVVATQKGVKMLSMQAIDGLAVVKQQLQFQGGPQAETAMAGLDLYEELFKWASTEVSELVVALDMNEDGSAALRKRVRFAKAGPNPSGKSADATAALERLPNWPYVVAFSGSMEELKGMDKWMEMSMKVMQGIGGADVPKEQLEKLMALSRKGMEGIRGVSFTMGVPAEGKTIYSRMGMVMEVKDSAAYIEAYLDATRKTKELFDGNEAMPYRILSVKKDGATNGMNIEMQITPAALGPGPGADQAKEIIDKMYGKDGKIQVFVAPIDAKHVALAYESRETLNEVIRIAKAKKSGFGSDAAIAKTIKMLPPKAQIVGFMSMPGSVDFVKRTMALVVPFGAPPIPDFPDSPPLGMAVQFDGASVEAGMYVPSEVFVAIGEFVQAAMAAAGQ